MPLFPTLVLALALAAAPAPVAAPDAAELTVLLNEFLAGASRNDVAAHEKFWAEDVIYTGSAGKRRGKAEILADVRSAPAPKPGDPSTVFTAEDIRIQQYGAAAIVAFRLVATTTKPGAVEVSRYLNTGTFLKRNGTWQVVSWQATHMPGAADAAKVTDAEATPTRLVLLGTKGGPRVDGGGRHNASTLLVIHGTPYVVDCGYGTSLQLMAAGVPLTKLRHVFVTHHHSDHDLELGPLAYNAWAAGLATPVDAYGPAGTEAMLQAFFRYEQIDIDTRIVDEGRPDLRTLVTAHDVTVPGVVLRNADVTVTAARVRHPLIAEAFAYRFDARDRSVVISGDTAYSPELVELARGADVLVHEVLYLPGIDALIARVPHAARLREHLLASHSTPEDVGRVAAAAGVKTVVLTHFVPGDDASITDDQWAEGVRKSFKGTVIVGKDLMEIP
jgi:ribonuclease BN (tRNA processing enzyme)/ketosteroid isomerase-like protein